MAASAKKHAAPSGHGDNFQKGADTLSESVSAPLVGADTLSESVSAHLVRADTLSESVSAPLGGADTLSGSVSAPAPPGPAGGYTF